MVVLLWWMACAVESAEPVASVEQVEPVEPVEETEPVQPLDGAVLFQVHCEQCHGAQGPDLVSSDQLVDQILEGKDTYPMMPAFADTLTDGEIAAIVDYVEVVLWGRE